MMVLAKRVSERRAEHLLADILESQGWDLRRPPQGDLLIQQEYKAHSHLLDILKRASKKGEGAGLPEAILVDRISLVPLAIVETKPDTNKINQAVKEATEDYGRPCIEAGYSTLAVGLAGTSEDAFDLRVMKWTSTKWVPITYEGNPITWIPTKADLQRILSPGGPTELRPTPPPPEVLAARADEINRLLREARIKDEYRPAVVGAIMLALWSSKGDIRKDQKFILADINQACKQAFWKAQKPDLAGSLRVDTANTKLATKARRIATILERLNVTVLTAEHDYLGQLYETFFRYTGGNTIGQYFTPRHVTAMMTDLCEVSKSDIVLDPACGTGGFLISAMSRVQKQERLPPAAVIKLVRERLIGFESEPTTAALCVANMILRGDGSTGVRKGDCFTSPHYPEGKATVGLMNPPFPHEKTDEPPEHFVERALEGLQTRGRLAVILPTSLLVKDDKGPWREAILKKNSLLAVCQMPDELFQPFASSTTSVVLLEKGVPHKPDRKSVFVRVQHDGLTLKKSIRVARPDGQNDIPRAIDAVLNKTALPGFAGVATISDKEEWAVGAYIPVAPPTGDELEIAVDVLLRRLASFYARYAAEIVAQRAAVLRGELAVVPYRETVGKARLANAAVLSSKPGTIGGIFDIFYGMKELHSREGIAPGRTLVISPTEEYNGCYGWLEFTPLIAPPFVTVAQTGSIGEAFVQLEPCAVNDDCLVLLPKEHVEVSPARLAIATACLHLERWRFNYGRKLTPQRICEFPVSPSAALEQWTSARIEAMQRVVRAALSVYEEQKDEDTEDALIARQRLKEIGTHPERLITGKVLRERLKRCEE